jgi:hypothetical protein
VGDGVGVATTVGAGGTCATGALGASDPQPAATSARAAPATGQARAERRPRAGARAGPPPDERGVGVVGRGALTDRDELAVNSCDAMIRG